MSYRPSTWLVWFGFAGGAVAWALQFVAGLSFSFAQCQQTAGRWQIPVRSWQVGLAVGGLVVGLASTTVAVRIFRRTFRIGDIFGMERRGDGSQPPLGRIHFLVLCGLVINFLVLTIVVLDGVGTALNGLCQQS
jgi:hypothetical protein